MDRREMLGLMGAGAAGVFAMGGSAVRADQQHDGHIEVMARCAKACAEAAAHCVEELARSSSNAQKHAKALKHTASCEEFCILSAKETACESPLARLAHQANAKACEECAKACEGFEAQVMKDCAEACRKCAETCRQLAG